MKTVSFKCHDVYGDNSLYKNGVSFMQLSALSRYAVRILLELSLQPVGQPLALAMIAERAGIALRPVENILATLRDFELVQSVRGAAGGYLLAKKPEAITLADIVDVMEDGVYLSVCCGNKANDCPKQHVCPSTRAWQAISEGVSNELRKTTLADVVQNVSLGACLSHIAPKKI